LDAHPLQPGKNELVFAIVALIYFLRWIANVFVPLFEYPQKNYVGLFFHEFRFFFEIVEFEARVAMPLEEFANFRLLKTSGIFGDDILK